MTTSPHFGTENAGFPVVLAYFVEEVIYTANSTLSLTDTARSLWSYQDVASTLSLSQTVVVAATKYGTANHELDLTDEALRVQTADVEDVLVLDSVIDYFNFVDDRKVAGDVLFLTQTVLSLASIPVTQTLSLTQNVVVQAPYKILVEQWLTLSDHLATPFFLDIEHDLGLTQLLPTPLYGDAESIIGITDEASITNVEHTLNLTHTASGSKLYVVSHILDLEQTTILESDWVRRVDQDLGVGHALTYFMDDPCALKQYSPFQGESLTGDTLPSATIPPTHRDATSNRVILYYPSAAAISRQIILRAPEFGNRDQNAYTRVSRETRGGNLIVYSDPDWPSIRTLACTITGLKSDEVEEYLEFLYATLGRVIELSDWEGRLWSGVMTNPEEPITQDGKDRYTISFQLEGQMYDSEIPTDETDGFYLSLTDSATVVKV